MSTELVASLQRFLPDDWRVETARSEGDLVLVGVTTPDVGALALEIALAEDRPEHFVTGHGIGVTLGRSGSPSGERASELRGVLERALCTSELRQLVSDTLIGSKMTQVRHLLGWTEALEFGIRDGAIREMDESELREHPPPVPFRVGPRPPGAASSDRRYVFCARTQSAADEMAELWLGPARPWRRTRDNRKIGKLLGYPRCCVRAFRSVAREPYAKIYNWGTKMAERNRRSGRLVGLGDPLTNLMSATVCGLSFLEHQPCTARCEATIEQSDRFLRAQLSEGQRERVIADLSVSWMVWPDGSYVSFRATGWGPDFVEVADLGGQSIPELAASDTHEVVLRAAARLPQGISRLVLERPRTWRRPEVWSCETESGRAVITPSVRPTPIVLLHGARAPT